jgi:hypothetical protein
MDPSAFTPEQVPASAPARRRRTALVVGAVVAVIVLVAGALIASLFLGPDDSGQATGLPSITTTHTTTSSQSPATAPTAAKYVGTLQALATPMPAGAVRQPLDMGAQDGSLDLDAVAAEYPDSNRQSVKNLLKSLEFERGLFLAWNDGQGYLVYVQIYQFHYGPQAAAWSAAEARGSEPESASALEGIPGGKWFTTTTPSGRGAVHARYYKGDLAVMLNVFRTGQADPEHLKQLAIDQYHRLP